VPVVLSSLARDAIHMLLIACVFACSFHDDLDCASQSIVSDCTSGLSALHSQCYLPGRPASDTDEGLCPNFGTANWQWLREGLCNVLQARSGAGSVQPTAG
jgi:hypothetical protein